MTPVEAFLLSFIPLFVAIDVFGVLPLFVGLTESMSPEARKRLTVQATATAFLISLVFLVTGKLLFSFLGITENDFRVGGGVLLLVLSVNDLLFSHAEKRTAAGMPGVVPIGIPLIMGPAALTTILLVVDTYGFGWATASLLVNLLLVWLVFSQAGRLTKLMGRAGSAAIAKVAALFLAGIAVMMIRSGIQAMLRNG